MEIRKFIYFLVASLLTISCAQITPLHSARTEGQGNLTGSLSVDGTGFAGNLFGTDNVVAIPGVRGEVAYGLTERVDLVGSLYTSGAFKFSSKYQVYGDNYSSFAVAAMPGYEYQTNIINTGTNFVAIQRLHLPLIFTISGGELLDYYLGPNVVFQFTNDPNETFFSGLFAGLEYGRRVKYNIGGGVFIPYTFNVNTSNGYLFQVGASARIPLFRD